MAQAGTDSAEWMSRLEEAYAIHSVVAIRPELRFFVLQWDGGDQIDWLDLGDPRHRLQPFHFEIFFGKESVRDAFHLEALREASATGEVVVRELFGFSDLFVALPGDATGQTFLYAGQFLSAPPTWERICDSWRSISGLEPASANTDFVHFVRMVLRLPVLDRELLAPMADFASDYASHLSSVGSGQGLRARVDETNRDHISRHWPSPYWVDTIIHSDKFLLPPWYYEGELVDWVKEALGIHRLPTTVMALMPLDPRSAALDPVQTLVRNAQIQSACVAFATGMPETVVTPLHDYGVSIITSCAPSRGRTGARLELAERAEQFRGFVREQFKMHSVVGIGPSMSRGAPLYESHREAVHTLHMCVQVRKSVLFFDDHSGAREFRYIEVQKAAHRLTEVLDRDSATELKLAADHYVQLVLRYSGERVEVVRGQFLAMLFQLMDVVQRRNPIRQSVRDDFIGDLALGLENAQSLNQVIEEFGHALQRVGVVAGKAWSGSNAMIMETTLQYLRASFDEPLPLPKVARKAGFSVPAFTRVFKKATGTTFVAYLRSVRVDHAKKLLTTTPLSLEEIAQSCGFNSQHHLIRSFKKVVGQTPGAYRKDQATRQGG